MRPPRLSTSASSSSARSLSSLSSFSALDASARFYAEAARESWVPARETMPQVPVPTALSVFEHDTPPGDMAWAKDYFDLRQSRTRSEGGHFGPAENPQAVIDDIRDHFRALR